MDALLLAVLMLMAAPQAWLECIPYTDSLVLGQAGPDDWEIYNGRVKLKGYKDVTFSYPLNEPKYMITMMEVTNNIPGDTGGCAYLIDGGVGTEFVQIQFETPGSEEIMLGMTLYGHPL